MTIFPQSNYRPRSYFGAGSVEVAPPARAGEGGIRRLATHTDALISEPAAGVRTIPDLIDYAARVHGAREALGSREVLGVHEETRTEKDKEGKEKKKTWKYWDLSEYKWISYVEFKDQVEDVAKGLVELGIGQEDVVDLFAETSANWQLMSCACALISTPIATAYDTLGASGLTHSLNEPSCAAIFTNPGLLPMVLKVLPDTPSVRYVFYDGTPSPAEEEVLAQIRRVRSSSSSGSSSANGDDGDKPEIKTLPISALLSLGQSRPSILLLPNRRPTPSTTACIMYTSGSTGAPKGVVLTHGNLLASVGAVHAVFQPHLPAGARYIAYLPLAHVLEYVVELCALFCGVGMGYGRVRTLTGQSIWRGGSDENAGGDDDAKDKETQSNSDVEGGSNSKDSNSKESKKMRGTGLGDLEELKPDVMLGVPAVWETVRKAVYAKLAKAPKIAQHAFEAAVRAKKATGAVVAYTSASPSQSPSSPSSSTASTTNPSSNTASPSTTTTTTTTISNTATSALKYIPDLLAHTLQRGVDGLLDETVLKQVRAAVGGNVKFAVNGGAPVSGETQDWFCAAVMPLVQGYGLTETCGMCAFLPPELLSTGPVGLPAPSVEIKLVDCKESRDLGYEACPDPDAKDADGNPVRPQGEIWIRGPSVTKGYYKRPDLNVVALEDGSLPDDEDNDDDAEKNDGKNSKETKSDEKEDQKDKNEKNDKKPDPVFTRDGWFRTGDVGRWNADGTLSIVDRLKNLVKLQGGEYIALERLEAIYKSCSLVSNLCLYANGEMTQPIAIVVPPKPGAGASSSSDKDAILSELADLAKKNNLSKMETPSHVVVGQEEWTPENGYVTAAQKVQRAKVAEGFKDEIEECKKAQKGK